jgi:hypothetical protein
VSALPGCASRALCGALMKAKRPKKYVNPYYVATNAPMLGLVDHPVFVVVDHREEPLAVCGCMQIKNAKRIAALLNQDHRKSLR